MSDKVCVICSYLVNIATCLIKYIKMLVNSGDTLNIPLLI